MIGIIIYILTEYFVILNLCFQNLKLEKKRTYLKEAKGYLILVIPGIVSIDHVHCQSTSTTIYHGAYAVNTLKVKLRLLKVEK